MKIYNPLGIFNQAGSKQKSAVGTRILGKTAVLWLNGAKTAHRNIWDTLWNQATMRYITDGGSNYVIHKENLKKPDAVTGDMDSITKEALNKLKYEHVKMIETPDQDKTDFTKSLEIIIEKSKEKDIDQIVVLGGLSGRFDHTLASLNTLYCSLKLTTLPIFLIDGENLLCIIGEGASTIHIDKSKITGKCGIVPLAQKQTIVTLEGFRWNLEEQEMKYGGLISTSNEIEANTLLIKTTAPLIFTVELRSDCLSA